MVSPPPSTPPERTDLRAPESDLTGPHVQVLDRSVVGPAVKELSRVDWWRPLAPLLLEWGAIVGILAGALWWDRWYGYVAAVVLLGGRQRGLSVLMHEGAHYRLSPHRGWNDLFTDFLCGLPLGLSNARYRDIHFAHHRFLNTERDPDHVSMERNPDYRVPTSRGKLLRLALGDLFGRGILSVWRNSGPYRPIGPGLGWRSWLLRRGDSSYTVLGTGDRVRFLAFVLIVGAGIVALPGELRWKVPALWVGSLLTTFGLYLRIGSFCEHRACPNTHELDATRHVDANLLERLLICPWRINYHVEHHVFPSVPQYNMPRLLRFLETLPEYRENIHRVRGYRMSGALGDLTGGGRDS